MRHRESARQGTSGRRRPSYTVEPDLVDWIDSPNCPQAWEQTPQVPTHWKDDDLLTLTCLEGR